MKIILKHSLFLLLICFSNTLIGQTKYKVEGIVRSSENKELLVGANVLLINKDLVVPTNNVGYFQIINDEKRFQLEISYIGFKTKKINLTIERDTTISIKLESSMLDEVVITENKSITNIIGNIELSRKEIKAIPPLLGEADVLRALALQPGVSGGTEGTVGLNVRGGSPDQNLLLLDDVRVYSQGHLLGFLSIFNSSVIQDVSLQKGVFDVEYGGRLSSIINVTTQSGNLDTTLNEFSLGLVSSSFLLSGHLSPKLSYMAGGRFANTLLYTLPSSIGYNKGSSNQSISYIMYDTNVHLKYKLRLNLLE